MVCPVCSNPIWSIHTHGITLVKVKNGKSIKLIVKPSMSEVEQSDFEKRKADFIVEYKVLIDKYMLDLFSFPAFVPSKEGDFRLLVQTEIIDKKALGVPSNFMG